MKGAITNQKWIMDKLDLPILYLYVYVIYMYIHGAASRLALTCILFEWHGLPQSSPPKTYIFLPNILNVKSKSNSLWILQKPTSFQEKQIWFTAKPSSH